MGLKSLSLVLFGLAFCCFLQGTAAQEDACQLRLMFGPALPDYDVHVWGEGSFTSPFAGWSLGLNGTFNYSTTLTNLGVVEKASSYCDYCVMTVFKGNNFNGTSQVVDFRTRVGDNSQITLSFFSLSYTLECFPPEEEYPEEEYPEEESEELPEEEEEEEEEFGEYDNAIFQQMNEGDGETLPHELVELRHQTVQMAIDRLVSKGVLPQGKYSTDKVYSTEFATNYEDIYRFNVQIRDESGVEFRIWFVAYSFHEDPEVYHLIDAGYKENRIGEFPNTEFKVLPPVEESQAPYPAEVEDLGKKAVNQAAVRLQAKGILPQGNYSTFVGYYFFTIVEYSAIVNMTEYPDQDDMLYRFNARVVDQSGTLFRVWAVIATNYETPEYYELIDYGYKQSRLSDFPDIDWMEMNEDEDMPLPGEIVDIRSRSVAQAVQRFIVEGTLPEGQYTIANTFITETAQTPESPDYQILTSQRDDTLYRFNVQLSNEAGARFRVAVVAVTNYMIQPKYELIDYFYIENTLDEFTNIKFISLDQDDLRNKSVNQAVDRLIAKDILPGGQYTVAKTYPTQFSSKFEHPYYSTDEDILYNFTVQVNNAAGTGFKIYAIVITDYADPTDYELIDYGKINA